MSYGPFLHGRWADEPEPPPGHDQLRFIVGLGANARVSVATLSACMSHKASEAARMMAVEIAERRLAEMPAQPPAPDPVLERLKRIESALFRIEFGGRRS